MKIRPYKSSDVNQIAQLFYDTVHAIGARDYSQAHLRAWAPANADAEIWNARLSTNISYVVDSFDQDQDRAGGIILGFGDMSPEGSLEHLYVHKDYQGKGIAKLITQTLLQDAEKLGLHEVTTVASITAKPFFEKLGFEVIEKYEKELRGAIFLTYRMKKVIGHL